MCGCVWGKHTALSLITAMNARFCGVQRRKQPTPACGGAGFWLQKNRPFATKNLASGNQKNRPFATTNYPYSSFLNRDILGSNLLLLRNFLVVEFFFILLVQFVRFFCKFVVQILNVIIF